MYNGNMKKINLNNVKTAYFIGIKGAGMTALAQMMKGMGFQVSGSDTKEKFFTDKVLAREGILVNEEFDEINITEKSELVIYSTAYNESNPEFKKAKELNLSMLSYPEALGLIMNSKKGIAITGTHGKTTITAMAGLMLTEGGKDPNVIIGSYFKPFSGNARVGKSDLLVIEADEYQNKLQYYNPEIVILNNIDYDHPDFYPTMDDYKKAFRDFISKLDERSLVIANFDDKNVREVAMEIKARVISFGKNNADFTVQLADDNSGENKFYVFNKEKNLGEFTLKVLGEHNVLNSLSVVILGLELGISLDNIRNSLSLFPGTERRMEEKGRYNGAIIYDDYAHHPTEIKATLKAFRRKYSKNFIYCIFHPHSYSRTEALLRDFAESFKEADKIIILDIYGSARENDGNVHSKDLVKEVENVLGAGKVVYISKISECVDYLKPLLRGGDVVITMGAGDVWRVGEELLKKNEL